MDKFHNITLALAGIFQAASLVNELATHGACNQDMFAHSINSIYKISSTSVEEIFADAAGVQLGLVQLEKAFSNIKIELSKQSLTYVIGIMRLERLLMKQPAVIATLRSGLEQIIKQSEYFGPQDPAVISSMASLYTDVLGKFHFRIMVQGKENYLQQADMVEKIRALLLAGVRAAVVWRQVGGSKLQLFIYRARLLKNIRQLLATTAEQ